MSQVEFFQIAESTASYTPTASSSSSNEGYPWWSSLRHGGCLIAPSRLAEFFPPSTENPLPSWLVDRLRRAVLGMQEEGSKGALDLILDAVLVQILGLDKVFWTAGNNLDADWSVRAITGEIVKPRRLWQEPNGGILPVFLVDEPNKGRATGTPALGLGRGRRWVARVIEWLRRKNQKIALLTNGTQWRLIHAGTDYDAWAEWDINVWFLGGHPGPQVEALRLLLGRDALAAPSHGEVSPLVDAILATRRGQSELSAALGERVRQAVELLLRESRSSIDQILDDADANVTKRDVYVAAVRLIMRLVVTLFAEARDRLLPIENPIYYRSYSLRGLIELLDRESGGRPLERLRDRYGAWPRLLGLFRLLYLGSAHEKLLVTRYGGGLFTPGDSTSSDAVLRALSALENIQNEVPDGVVAVILQFLSQAPVKVRQGRGSTEVMAPVDFSQLDTEYIGILYEGLLDYELRRTDEGIPLLFLNIGKQPALPLTRLEEMDDKALEDLVKKLGKVEKSSKSDEDSGDEGDDEDDDSAGEEDQEAEETSDDAAPAASLSSTAFDDSDVALQYRERAHAWARRAAQAGKLVSKPRGKMTEDKQKTFEADLDRAATRLVARLVLPGEYYLVRFGGTRKGSGTFYTKPALAGPTIRRTLQPLCYAFIPSSQIHCIAGVSPAVAGSPGTPVLNIREGRHLPHWTQAGSTYHVVFRLADSVPRDVADAWLRERDDIIRRAKQMKRHLSEDENQRLQNLFSDKVEAYLDQGAGACWMNRPDIADIVEGALRHFDGERYELLAWAVMPNHVHTVVRPIGNFELPEILHSWKSFTAHEVNKILGRSGEFWAEEYYDRLIRKEGEFDRTVAYVLANPTKARLKHWKYVGTTNAAPVISGVSPAFQANSAGETPAVPDSPAVTETSPRTPVEILDLKVADIACGSGSFLVGSLRYLTGALYESLLFHGWLKETEDGRILWANLPNPVPAWFADALQDFSGLNEPALRQRDHEAGQTPEEKIRARLKRVVVERCIYGVDLDPLAVELARLALWVETMDPYLPFSFLDHKVKFGNALVGTWFDRFQDYPALAWEREGGDKTHSNGVHFPKDGWTKAIAKVKREVVKDELADLIRALAMNPNNDLYGLPEQLDHIHAELVALWAELHEQRHDDPEAQRRVYERIQHDARYLRLKQAFDTWCAVWFWPADQLDIAPTPNRFHQPPDTTAATVEHLARQHCFMHWELEFPDVFSGPDTGFSAIVGNPPWETLQPVSKEWFSNLDPLYRTYGKQEAISKQKAAFTADQEIEQEWLLYTAGFKELSNWMQHAARPFGYSSDEDEGGTFSLSSKRGESARLHEAWAGVRAGRIGYADPEHPFKHQGDSKPYTYKMFLEQAHALVRTGGRVGFIVPSGIYTDGGSVGLRNLFLERCRWEWLFGFENRNKVFDIDSRFKFCPVIIEKGGRTEAIKAAFMRHDVADWEDGERFALDYPADRITRFSPKSKAVLEVRTLRDLRILEKMYSNGVLLGDDGPDGWGIKYKQGDFNMTSDSKLFPPRPQWEAKGYVADEYGHWLKGNWRSSGIEDDGGVAGVSPAQTGALTQFDRGRDARDTIKSRDGTQVIAIGDIEDVALPLYEGRMIGQFDFSQKGWVSGKGRSAVWREIEFSGKVIEPQYLMSLKVRNKELELSPHPKIAMMDVTSSTNSRTMIAATIGDSPCGHKVPTLTPKNYSPKQALAALALFNSLPYDYQLRSRFGATSLIWGVLEDTAVPSTVRRREDLLASVATRLSFPHQQFASYWQVPEFNTPWRSLWALAPHERLRLRCILDATVAHLYGLDEDDFRWILCACDHPSDVMANNVFRKSLDPKGFWRIGSHSIYIPANKKGTKLKKSKVWDDPELRHTVLAQIAFADLQVLIAAKGEDEALRHFLGTGPDDGWMIPETLTLATYKLGHDDRARQPQPVAERLGPRFYDFQLSQSPEESWAECRAHAAKIERIRSIGIVADQPANTQQKRKGKQASVNVVEDLFSSIPAEVPAPITRQQAIRSLVLHLINTRPGMLEYEYYEVLRLLSRRHELGAAFTDEEQDEFVEACSRLPQELFDESESAQISWSETYRFLKEFDYVTSEKDGDIYRFWPAIVIPEKYPYMTWNFQEIGHLLFKAWEAEPKDVDALILSRERLDMVTI